MLTMWTMWRGCCTQLLWTRANGKSPLSCHAVRRCSAPALPAASITALQAVDLWRRCFEQRGVTEPRMSSHYIIAHLLGAKTIQSLEQEKLIEFLSREQMEQVWELCTKRLSRVPVQYVIEEWDFRDITLKMKPPVFIPRPETEELVELVLTDLQTTPGVAVIADTQRTFIEVGCGSGAISLSLLKSLPQLKAVALDQSVEAVDLTWENALRLGVQDRIKLHNMDIMKDGEALLSICDPAVALVSNPPYLFSDDMSTLEPEIFRYEDHAALDGGVDGLKVIKQILMIAPQILLNHGRVYLEVEPRHPPLIRQWVEVNVEELRYIETRHDITGRPRFCILQREES
ncbi:MTRF1L release factor glutamine methyltransferase isoform X2 [Gouania willdenowi]|uniref:peptide chain release factor N(5)-glutamine methyltransferase n=1 Tax=Gouania willdenowi TaxID=441366 RepID=A0A8C5HMK6_GOUWI|nr:hemK methyltransferase family member 1 isoform X2 [Gouania willdenowi]